MAVEVGCTGELGRAMRTELCLRQNWYVAPMIAHLG